MSQSLPPQLPILRAHGHEDVALRLREVPNWPLDPSVGQTADHLLGLGVRDRPHGERPVQRSAKAFRQVFGRDKLGQLFRSFGSGQDEDLPGGRGIEAAGDETPDGGEEGRRPDDEDPLHRLRIVRRGHAAGGLKDRSQIPELPQPNIGEIDDVYGFIDGDSVIPHPVAQTLREVRYVFCREEDTR